MRSSILSGLIIASTVSIALGAPTASSSLVQSSSTVNHAHHAEPSIDPRIERWARMKIALPDGLFPEDRVVLKEQLKIVPMIVIDELPQRAVLARKPVRKHQRIDIERMGGIIGDKDKITTEMQQNLNQRREASFSSIEHGTPNAGGRPYRKYLGVSDSGESPVMNLLTTANTQQRY